MLGFIIRRATYFGIQHREIVGDDEIEFLFRPISAFAIGHERKMNQSIAGV